MLIADHLTAFHRFAVMHRQAELRLIADKARIDGCNAAGGAQQVDIMGARSLDNAKIPSSLAGYFPYHRHWGTMEDIPPEGNSVAIAD
ncbi:hypothetical protein GCM10008933_42630 [Paenibacillus motobuensis]|uniref:Uncharacterized protein n=1 Tax=Paenibacillus motobuensis TaxID=295324 RepID=A0ABN0YRZ6_9BACL